MLFVFVIKDPRRRRFVGRPAERFAPRRILQRHLTGMLKRATLLLYSAPACLGLFEGPIIRPSPPRWELSTLHQEIRANHVHAAAFQHDGSTVDVLDSDGERHRVDVFPGAEMTVVEDLRDSRVPFFVTPEPPNMDDYILMIAITRAMFLTSLVIVLIDFLGLMEDFIWGCILVGAGVAWTLEALDKGLEMVSRCGARTPD